MCLVTYAVDSHPTYKLILASNRDEYLHRPTEPVRGRSASDLSKPGKEVYCGLDAVAGGTWLGLTREGRVGVLTNFTEPPPPTPPLASRGSILSNFFASPAAAAAAPAAAAAGTSTSPEVSAPLSPLAYLSELAPTGPTYAGFNTLLFSLFPPSSSSPDAGASDPSAPLPAAGADAEVAYFSNRLPAPAAPVAIAARTGALSNSLWDDPWEKTVGAKHAIDRLLEEERAGVAQGQKPWRKSDWIDRLKEVMSHSVPTVDRSTFRQSTSIPPLLLPLPDPTAPPRWYATRLLTVILVTHAGEFEFYESDVWQLRRDRDDPDGVEVRRATSSQSFSGTLTPGR